ncbi:helicase associated domain-containing protein [Streptomyces sp. NPDC058231]|uniref:helicase associated domain-containing protein n=1 Tax=Streptomyces sp. NPDC058231 TaxID=3346392 RepID=UPI0036E4BA13
MEAGGPAARAFHDREGHLDVPRRHPAHLDGKPVRDGQWISNARRRKDRPPADRLHALDALDMRGQTRPAEHGVLPDSPGLPVGPHSSAKALFVSCRADRRGDGSTALPAGQRSGGRGYGSWPRRPRTLRGGHPGPLRPRARRGRGPTAGCCGTGAGSRMITVGTAHRPCCQWPRLFLWAVKEVRSAEEQPMVGENEEVALSGSSSLRAPA